MATQPLRSLTVSGWRQFDDVRLNFHDRLTIITGPNGAGKTTLLNMIAPHFGWTVPLATAPDPTRSALAYITNVWRSLSGSGGSAAKAPTHVIGKIEYDQGSTDIVVPTATAEHTYQISYDPPHTLTGIFIPSHRPVFVPTAVKAPHSPVPLAMAQQRYSEAVRSAWVPGPKPTSSPLQVLKEALLSWLVAVNDPVSLSIVEDLTNVLQQVTPRWLGFRGFAQRDNEVLLSSESGDFTIDAVSGGIAALIDLTWQLFLFSRSVGGRFIVLIDEPENHLHPQMQRSVLYNLTRAFPQAQFIVSSHAPMVVTSVRDAVLYVLVSPPRDDDIFEAGPREPQRKVVNAVRLDQFDRAGTANDVLRNVLGLDTTMPIWAANIIDDAIVDVAREDYSADALRRFDRVLSENDLEQYSIHAIARMRRSIEANPPVTGEAAFALPARGYEARAHDARTDREDRAQYESGWNAGEGEPLR